MSVIRSDRSGKISSMEKAKIGRSVREIVSWGIQSEFFSSIRCISVQMRQISDRFFQYKIANPASIWLKFGRSGGDSFEHSESGDFYPVSG